MSLEQQEARICEAPTAGWVVWLSSEAMELVKSQLDSIGPEDGDEFRLARDILEGIY